MQVFKAFYKILWKKKNSIILYTAIFLGLALGLASTGDNSIESSFKEEKHKVAIFDYDKSQYSNEFVKYLSAHTTPVKYEDDAETLRDHLFIRDISAVIYIKENFSDNLEKGNVEELIEVTTLPGSIYNQTILNYIEQYMSTLHAYLKADFSLDEAIIKTADIVDTKASVSFSTQKTESGNSPIYYFMLYLPYVLTSCSILGIGTCIMVFNQKEVKNRMNVSSYSLLKRNIGLWGGSILAEFALAGFFILVATVVHSNELLTRNGLLMIVNILAFVTVALGLTFLIGMLSKKETVLDMISNVVGLGFSFLGGIFVPLSFMGDGIKSISSFIPTYWYVQALNTIENGNFTEHANDFWLAIGIQLAFATAFTAIGMGITKIKRRSN